MPCTIDSPNAASMMPLKNAARRVCNPMMSDIASMISAIVAIHANTGTHEGGQIEVNLSV